MRWVLVLAALLTGCPADPRGGEDPPDAWPLDAYGEDAEAEADLDRGLDARVTPMIDMAQPDMRVLPDLALAGDMRPADMTVTADMRVMPPDMAPPMVDMALLDMAPPDMAPPDMAIVDMTPPDMMAPDPDMALPDMGPDPLARPPVERCAPARPLGWACFSDDRACAGALTCIAGLCADQSEFEGPCDGNSDCRAGQQLFCARYSNQGANLEQPFCRQRGVVGEACHRRNFGCDFGLVCVNDLCQERSPVGGPCVTSGDCDNTSWCDVTALCAPFIPLGDPCNPQAPGCEPGFACTNERCAERAPPGDDCQHAGQCAVGQYCDRFDDTGDRRAENVCTPRLQEGDPCDARETSVCSGSVCLEGLCAVDVPEEGACQSSFDCEAGFWCPQAR